MWVSAIWFWTRGFVRVNRNYVLTEYVLNENNCASQWEILEYFLQTTHSRFPPLLSTNLVLACELTRLHFAFLPISRSCHCIGNCQCRCTERWKSLRCWSRCELYRWWPARRSLIPRRYSAEHRRLLSRILLGAGCRWPCRLWLLAETHWQGRLCWLVGWESLQEQLRTKKGELEC